MVGGRKKHKRPAVVVLSSCQNCQIWPWALYARWLHRSQDFFRLPLLPYDVCYDCGLCRFGSARQSNFSSSTCYPHLSNCAFDFTKKHVLVAKGARVCTTLYVAERGVAYRLLLHVLHRNTLKFSVLSTTRPDQVSSNSEVCCLETRD